MKTTINPDQILVIRDRINAARQAAAALTYSPIDKAKIPAGVRFDTPARLQGQMITTSYGGFFREEHDYGDKYMSVHDSSDDTSAYFVRDEYPGELPQFTVRTEERVSGIHGGEFQNVFLGFEDGERLFQFRDGQDELRFIGSIESFLSAL